ncbi:hypothetical protein SELMODRAFT_429754 [Selaginella moellendorffii]|uniref:Uncharacterized protein n=1 Tax=Selaginella moellendorffii TaxID=88036 RepID=D8T769_SELML|nr:hypothetical protein SELMODRAFT_429754 [Selaginella moellendorffii]
MAGMAMEVKARMRTVARTVAKMRVEAGVKRVKKLKKKKKRIVELGAPAGIGIMQDGILQLARSTHSGLALLASMVIRFKIENGWDAMEMSIVLKGGFETSGRDSTAMATLLDTTVFHNTHDKSVTSISSTATSNDRLLGMRMQGGYLRLGASGALEGRAEFKASTVSTEAVESSSSIKLAGIANTTFSVHDVSKKLIGKMAFVANHKRLALSSCVGMPWSAFTTTKRMAMAGTAMEVKARMRMVARIVAKMRVEARVKRVKKLKKKKRIVELGALAGTGIMQDGILQLARSTHSGFALLASMVIRFKIENGWDAMEMSVILKGSFETSGRDSTAMATLLDTTVFHDTHDKSVTSISLTATSNDRLLGMQMQGGYLQLGASRALKGRAEFKTSTVSIGAAESSSSIKLAGIANTTFSVHEVSKKLIGKMAFVVNHKRLALSACVGMPWSALTTTKRCLKRLSPLMPHNPNTSKSDCTYWTIISPRPAKSIRSSTSCSLASAIAMRMSIALLPTKFRAVFEEGSSSLTRPPHRPKTFTMLELDPARSIHSCIHESDAQRATHLQPVPGRGGSTHQGGTASLMWKGLQPRRHDCQGRGVLRLDDPQLPNWRPLLLHGESPRTEGFIRKMPFHAAALVWMTLLGACRTRTKEASDQVSDFNPEHAQSYIVLSNVYVEN